MQKRMMTLFMLICGGAYAQVPKPLRSLKPAKVVTLQLRMAKGALKTGPDTPLDSTAFASPNAYWVPSYYSSLYLSLVDFAPAYILDSTCRDTKIGIDLFSFR